MSIFADPGRQAGHVLLDAVSMSIDGEGDATNLAYQRLMEIDGAIVIKVDDPRPDQELDVALDLSNVLGPTLVTTRWLIDRLAKLENRSREVIIVELREYLDT